MSSLVVVAIPNEDDPVWRASSERIPHLTLLYLGESTANPNVSQIIDTVRNRASSYLMPFSLRVDHSGILGKDRANVLFFSKEIHPQLRRFRMSLLEDTNIRSAYNAVPQHPEWTPHLTLGYPDTPPRSQGLDIEYVTFDRIAIWFGDYEGFEFQLRSEIMPELRLSDIEDNPLTHYGVKGMRWGRRRSDPGSSQEVTVRTTPRKLTKTQIKTRGGRGLPASTDAVRAAISAQRARKSGPQALSNRELQELVTRMNLEQQYTRLRSTQPESAGRAFVREVLKDVATDQVRRLAKDTVTRQVSTALVPVRR